MKSANAIALVLLVAVVGLAPQRSAMAGPANWNLTVHSAPRASQFMLYIGRPIGGAGGGGPRSFFGFRINQVRIVSNSRPDASDGLQQKELLRWQFERNADIHMDFGRNVTWDLTRGAFGPRRSVMTTYALGLINFHTSRQRPPSAARPAPEQIHRTVNQ